MQQNRLVPYKEFSPRHQLHIACTIRYRQQNKQKSLEEHRRQRKLPRITHYNTHRIGKESIKPHTRSKRQRQFRIKPHKNSGDTRHYHSSSKQRPLIHPRLAEDIRIHSQNIGHSQESSQSRHNLCTHSRLLRIVTKQFCQHKLQI